MVVLIPSGGAVPTAVIPSNIIASRRSIVAMELGNRADIQQLGPQGAPSRIDNWIWQAYLNLGMSYRFAESEMSASTQWQAGMDSIDYPADARAILNVAFYRQDGNSIRVKWKDSNYLRRYPTQNAAGNPNIGSPTLIAPYGQKILVRPLCDQSIYDVVIDYWQKPVQIVGEGTDAYTVQGPQDIGATVLNVPDDWLEIIDYGAKLRGHADLGEPDRAQALQQLLYGFTVPLTNKFVPGLIAQMWTRRQAEAPNMDYNLQPTSARRNYTNVG